MSWRDFLAFAIVALRLARSLIAYLGRAFCWTLPEELATIADDVGEIAANPLRERRAAVCVAVRFGLLRPLGRCAQNGLAL